jgi:hypothetical protein
LLRPVHPIDHARIAGERDFLKVTASSLCQQLTLSAAHFVTRQAQRPQGS